MSDIAHLADHTIASIAELPALAEAAWLMFYDPRANDHGLPVDPFKALVAPRPIGWISSLSADGIANLAPYSFFNAVCRASALRRLRLRRPQELGREYRGDGRIRGQSCDAGIARADEHDVGDGSAEIDEFEFAGLTKAACRLIKPPRVAASPACLECVLHQVVPLPDDKGHADNFAVIGRVVGIHIDDRFIDEGRVDTAAMQPIARLGYSEYATVTEAWRMRRPD